MLNYLSMDSGFETWRSGPKQSWYNHVNKCRIKPCWPSLSHLARASPCVPLPSLFLVSDVVAGVGTLSLSYGIFTPSSSFFLVRILGIFLKDLKKNPCYSFLLLCIEVTCPEWATASSGKLSVWVEFCALLELVTSQHMHIYCASLVRRPQWYLPRMRSWRRWFLPRGAHINVSHWQSR
jgi:hypothetical protein